MPSLGVARKTSTSDASPVTLRKQSHRVAHPNSRINAAPIGRKSAHPGGPRRALYTAPDSVRARKSQTARRPFVTSQSYAIAGVAGFHRGAQLPFIVSPQSERRRKPIAYKNLGDPCIDHGPKAPREVNTSDRSLAAKSLVRRAKATTQVTSSRKRDLLLNQHRNQVNSTIYASIVFGRIPRNQHSKLATQSEGSDEEVTLNSTNNFMRDRVPEPASAGGDDTAWKNMVTTFGALSLSTATVAKKRRLPFLRRIVRTSFRRRCQRRGLAVDPVSPQLQLLTILYKEPIDLSDNEWDNEVAEYVVHEVKIAEDQLVCPLCDTLGRLETKEILEAHLEWDHAEVEVSWRKGKDGSWELALELPGKELLVDVDEWGETESSRSSPTDHSVRPWSPVGASPASETDPRARQTPSQEIAVPVEHPVPTFKFEAESSPTLASRTASLIPDATGDSIHQVPHPRDPLGPLGVYPYLPSSTDDDNDGLRFSCRPCGPRLFDLVARYPMSEYGLTSWSLLERDEELFEIDDVRDEEKAMQALWNRWILSKQRRYLLDPRKLVTEFVETFQRTITETAGWKGLRVWLLLLAKHKLLTGDDIVTVMGHYETITGTGR